MGRRGLCIGGAAVAMVLVGLAGSGCAGGEDSGSGGVQEGDLVAFQALESTYRQGLKPAFRRTIEGEEVSFSDSFGPSAAQADAVAEGEPASIVHFERIRDVERLIEAGDVAADWTEQPYNGIANRSVIVFVVRKGNPLQIHNVRHLLEKDLEVVIPDPLGSAAGQWSVMDIYATRINERKSEAEALAAVRTVLEKTVARPPSAAAALATFIRGRGDVLLTYESEAIQAIEAGRGKHFQFLVPHQTILVENPIAATEEAPQPAAQDFLDFVWSDEGQVILAEHGFRPANPRLVDQERFFPRHDAFRIERFGGWRKVEEDFFDEETGSVAAIERELGLPVGDASSP